MKLELIIKSIVKIKETSIPRSGIHESVILTKKRKLFNKAVIRHAAQENKRFYITIFVVPKKQKRRGTILNVKLLNQLELTLIPKSIWLPF